MPLHPPATTPLPRQALSNPLYRPTRTRAWRAVGTMLAATLAALSMTFLGGCGGGDAVEEPAAATGTAPSVRQTAVDFTLESEYGPGDAPGSTTHGQARALATVTALVEAGNENRAAVPVDGLAHTRAGRYVSRAAAEREDAESGGRIVWVDAGCCAGLDAELPERIAFGMLAVLGDETPLYVTGTDLRQAARLADRLHALGLRRVHLVTP